MIKLNSGLLLIRNMRQTYGDSSQESRQAVVDAHGGLENVVSMANIWAQHHNIDGLPLDLQIAYATAADLGYRIAITKRR